jgi:hypothetical protein
MGFGGLTGMLAGPAGELSAAGRQRAGFLKPAVQREGAGARQIRG